MKKAIIFSAIFLQIALSWANAQCSKVYFYRPTGITQCEYPVYVYQDDNIVATLRAGERVRAEVCTSGSYTFSAKLNPESITLAKTSITVDGQQDQYIKVGCVLGVDLATIKDQDKETGQRDIGRESRFVSGFTQISLGPPSSLGATTSIASSHSQPPAGQSRAYQQVQIVNNFKFEIIGITRAGSTAQINFKITNLAPDDRMLYLNRPHIHFYDDMGAIVYPDQLCLVDDCHNAYFQSCKGSRDCILSPVFRHEASKFMPSGIPLNASLTFQNLNKRATKLVRGSIWFGCCGDQYKSGDVLMNEIPYGEIIFPSPIDPYNPNKRTIASLGIELNNCQVVGTEARLNLTLKNLGDIPFELVFQQGSAFDDQGNQYTISGFAYANESKEIINQWNNGNNQARTLHANSSVKLQLFIENIHAYAALLKRIDLYFNGYDLSWQDAPLQRSAQSATSSGESGNGASMSDYITYADLQLKLAKRENLVGRKVILENIYFSSGSDQILSDSYTQLNQLSNLLQSNPNLKVEISGHTDAVGDDTSNLLLSQKRADAIKYILISKAIDPARIISIGKGESEFIASNDSEQGKAKNRRVELKIIE